MKPIKGFFKKAPRKGFNKDKIDVEAERIQLRFKDEEEDIIPRVSRGGM